MKKFRKEKDFLGQIKVNKNDYWGAETQRSLKHFSIGSETMPKEIIKTYALYKKCAALANKKLNLFDNNKIPDTIIKVCDEIIAGKHKHQFPVHIWQTGSGTHTNMNMNEVISNIGIEKLRGKLGSKKPIHPNDDVNMSQSSNDSFPSVMYMTIAILINKYLNNSLSYFINGLKKKKKRI